MQNNILEFNSCVKSISNILEINGVEYLINKRYICSSKEHGAIESDSVDMQEATPCKPILKWTTDSPTEEGCYWLKWDGEFSIICLETIIDIRNWSRLQGSEWYGPIESPKYP